MKRSMRVERLYAAIKPSYQNGDPGHDVSHIDRVMATCERLGAVEGADIEILVASAMLHDVVNLPKDHPERLQASQMAAKQSLQHLQEAGFESSEIERITNIIIEHSYSLGKQPSSIESAILQDADKLDALGAIGIMRAVTCGCRLGSSYYDPQDPLAEERELNDKRNTIDHFFTKLYKLPALMNTKEGRNEANRRVEFMRQFLRELWIEAGVEAKTGQSDR